MNDVLKVDAPSSVKAPLKSEEPKSFRIALVVCDCYCNDRLTFITENARRVAKLLGISLEDLECHAVRGMLTGQPQIVDCYKSLDLAATKVAQLEGELPFISKPCHSFKLLDEG